MYKDKSKQKEASKERVRRYRASQKALQKGVTSQGVTEGVTEGVTGMTQGTMEGIPPKGLRTLSNLPANFGQPDCECRHCRQNRRSERKLVVNHGVWKTAEQLGANEVNWVSLPGDEDYNGCAIQAQTA